MKKLLYYIHDQVHGFLQSGKKIVPAANKKELIMSRFLAVLILILMIILSLTIYNQRDYLPVRIYFRFVIILIPTVSFVVLLYKGISLKWLVSGLFRYWLLTGFLLFTALILISLFVELFIPGSVSGVFLLASFIPIFTGIIFGAYFRVKAKRNAGQKRDFSQIMTALFYNLFSLIFLIFLFGGLALFAQFSGIADWFFKTILGW